MNGRWATKAYGDGLTPDRRRPALTRLRAIGLPSHERTAGRGRGSEPSLCAVVRSLGLAIAAGLLLAGCPDPVTYDGLYITNVTEAPIRAFLVQPDGSTALLTTTSQDATDKVYRLYTLDPNGDDCTDFPISVRQGGVEIERFDPPVCWDDGYEILTVRQAGL